LTFLCYLNTDVITGRLTVLLLLSICTALRFVIAFNQHDDDDDDDDWCRTHQAPFTDSALLDSFFVLVVSLLFNFRRRS